MDVIIPDEIYCLDCDEVFRRTRPQPPKAPAMATELPKQELLAKLLKMTTSTNDGEALTAMRKANSLLASAGWDWDRLLAGKITVVADPFTSLQEPERRRDNAGNPTPPRRYPTPPPPPQQQARPRPTPAPPPPPRPTPPPPPKPYSSKRNIYPGGCYCCGITVDVNAGFVFRPKDENPSVKVDMWAPICTACNNSGAFVPSVRAKRIFPPEPAGINPSLNNL